MKNRGTEIRNITIFVSLLICALTFSCDKPEESKVIANGAFELKLNSLGPDDPLPFAPYAYSVQVKTSNGFYKTIKRWNQDDPWRLSKIDVKVLNERVGYYFNVQDFAVTVDGGHTWQGFDYQKARAEWFGQFRTGGWPRVEIRSDGSGELYEQKFDDSNGPRYATFLTSDFGQTWAVALRSPPMWGEFQTRK